MDFGLAKVTRITERQSIELRIEALNVFNHVSFFDGTNYNDLSTGTPDTEFVINQPNFGRISQTFSTSREVQLGLRYRF